MSISGEFPAGGRSQYRGVSWHKAAEKWETYIRCDGKKCHLGYFHCEEEAAKTHDAAARKQHGQDAAECNLCGMLLAIHRQDCSVQNGTDNRAVKKGVGIEVHEEDEEVEEVEDQDEDEDKDEDEEGAEEVVAVVVEEHRDEGGTRCSEFQGVSWSKHNHRWRARIKVDGKDEHLGYFENEVEAALKFDEQARGLGRTVNFEHDDDYNDGEDDADADCMHEHEVNKQKRSMRHSEFRGVSWYKNRFKWRATININGTTKHLGLFDEEVEAARAFDDHASQLGRTLNFEHDSEDDEDWEGVSVHDGEDVGDREDEAMPVRRRRTVPPDWYLLSVPYVC